MADEVNYHTHFLSFEEAMSFLHGQQQMVVSMAYQLWLETVEVQSQSWYQEHITELHALALTKSPARAGADHSQDRLASNAKAVQDADSWENSD